MFPTSSQKKFWMFADQQDIDRYRETANTNFIAKHGADMSEEQRSAHFLSAADEKTVALYYQYHLRDFCRAFRPAMPRAVVCTSAHYFKRFYVNNSIMDFHPKGVLVTCVYLACKVEEFNVSMSQFVANVKGDKEKAMDIVLELELVVIHAIHYHLTVLNPLRPIEGLLIDIKTRCPQLPDVDRLRPYVDEFIDCILFTDALLLYSPSQLALASILYAASRLQENLDAYVTTQLLANASRTQLHALVEAVRKIRLMAKMVEQPARAGVKLLEKRLEKCRNQDNNPESQVYKKRMREMLEEDDDFHASKFARC